MTPPLSPERVAALRRHLRYAIDSGHATLYGFPLTELLAFLDEREALLARVKELSTPDIVNTLDSDGCEFAETDFDGLFDVIPPLQVREVWANKSLPHHWAAHVVLEDDSSRIELYATEAEALTAAARSTEET